MVASTKQQDSDESKNIQQNNKNQDSVVAILKFMNSYAEKLSFSAEKDFVFILGNTGAGMLRRTIRVVLLLLFQY